MNKLFLSIEIYSREMVQATIVAFSELAEIECYEEKGYYVCAFEKVVYQLEETIKEFENYLIDLSVKTRC